MGGALKTLYGRCRDPQAYASLLVMAGMGVVVTVGIFLFSQAVTSKVTTSFFRRQTVRDLLFQRIVSYLSSPDAIRSTCLLSATQPINAMLVNCLQGASGTSNCVSGVAYPLSLFPLSETSPVTGPYLTTPLNPNVITRYTPDGVLCPFAQAPVAGAPSSACPIQATATVTATCAGGASNCQIAESLSFYAQVDWIDSNLGITWTPMKSATWSSPSFSYTTFINTGTGPPC